MATGAEIAGYIINGLLSARKYATKRIEQFTKMRLLSREVNFYDPIQRITIATLLKKKKETEKGNTCPQRRSLGCRIICEKVP